MHGSCADSNPPPFQRRITVPSVTTIAEIESIYRPYQVLLLNHREAHLTGAPSTSRPLGVWQRCCKREPNRSGPNLPTVFYRWCIEGSTERLGIKNCAASQKERRWRGSTKKSKASATLPAKVEKVIKPHPQSGEPEKAQIVLEGADHLYREIRVPNSLTDDHGGKVRLKEGAGVEVKIEADPVVTQAAHDPEKTSEPPHP